MTSRRWGSARAATIHLWPRCLKIAFADRAAASGDPDFVNVPVERLTSKAYADERRGAIDPARAQQWGAGVAAARRRAHHPHDGGGCVWQRGRDHADHQQSVRRQDPDSRARHRAEQLHEPVRSAARATRCRCAPGKRVTTSMSPVMALRDGKLVYALGLPGGKRIFPSAMQALINLIDHGMSLQEAVEAPRVWTEGNALEVEQAVPERVRADARVDGARGRRDGDGGRRHERDPVPRRRLADRRGLLARRRHAGRHFRRTCPRRHSVQTELRARWPAVSELPCRIFPTRR